MSWPLPWHRSEEASLLRDPDEEATGGAHGGHPRKKTFAEHVDAITSEPLTTLAKILLVVALLLLLLTSVFIGLFAGAEHKLRNGRTGAERPTATATSTRISTVHDTSTLVSTSTVAGTTTVIGTTTITSASTVTATTTQIQKTTVPSVPAPTSGPGAVRLFHYLGQLHVFNIIIGPVRFRGVYRPVGKHYSRSRRDSRSLREFLRICQYVFASMFLDHT